MRIAKLLSVVLIVVLAVGLIGCKKPAATKKGGGATTKPATTKPATTKPAATVATVNAKCPMMDGEFNSAKVAPDLVRDFAGKKVGFCSAKCLPKWDNLSDVDKAAKLAAVTAPAP